MRRIKLSEVPKDYRRDYKKEFIEVLKMFAVCSIFVAILVFMVWMT